MEIQFYGANCIRISTKKASIMVDDNLDKLGGKNHDKDEAVSLFTHGSLVRQPQNAKLIIDQPGEYEVSNVSIQGVAARAHMDEEGKQTATMYKITADDIKVVVVGHIYPELNDSQLEQLGTVDILIVPVGNHGYTLDGIGALKVIKKIEPKVVIPTHYADETLKFEVPQQTLDQALKQMSMEAAEKVSKLKIKPADLPETTQLIILEKS